MRVLLLPVLAGLLLSSGCSSAGDTSSAARRIYVDTVIPRKVNRIEVAPGETMTLGRALDEIGGLVPEEKDGYIQILREGVARPIVIPVGDVATHRADVLQPGDSVYIGLKRNN